MLKFVKIGRYINIMKSNVSILTELFQDFSHEKSLMFLVNIYRLNLYFFFIIIGI